MYRNYSPKKMYPKHIQFVLFKIKFYGEYTMLYVIRNVILIGTKSTLNLLFLTVFWPNDMEIYLG